MFVILLDQKEEAKQILNVIYTTNESIVRKWVMDYVQKVVSTLSESTCGNNKTLNVIEDKHSCMIDVTSDTTKKGYLYNTTKTKKERLLELSWYEYDNKNETIEINDDSLSLSLNEEINNRVLKQLDKESLYQLIIRVQQRLKHQEKWSYIEYTNLMSEMVSDFKKELYSNVAKKMKRFGKRTTSILTQRTKLVLLP
jgi:hypothetical protein